MKSEAEVKARIQRAVGIAARLFVNVRGKLWAGRPTNSTGDSITLLGPRRAEVGLTKGASDLVGWQSVVITPEMVGSTVAIFVAIETKPEKGNQLSAEQANFIYQVRNAGGLAGVARSVEDAKQILGIK